jgi:hypothetical protein
MRQVAIIEVASDQRPWVAVDATTREPVLRMQRLEMLLTISRNLGWEVVADTGSSHLRSSTSLAAA